jgi:hypothetical protein
MEHVSRIRWLAGSKLNPAALDCEQTDLERRQRDVHEGSAHPDSTASTGNVIATRVRAPDGSVMLAMYPSEAARRLAIGSAGAAVGVSLRGWLVAVGHDVLTLTWEAGSRIAGRLRGHLASDGLSCAAMRLAQPGPAPTVAKPFRLLRVAADRKAKTPETLMIELAAAGDPAAAKAKPDPANANHPPPGLRIGAADANGFVPLLEVIPGRGVVMRGNVKPVRRIVRKPPGSEPSDEQLMQAFLRSDAGKKELRRIKEDTANIKLDFKSPTVSDGNRRCDFSWTLTNGADLKLSRLKVMATLMIRDEVTDPSKTTPAPVWTELASPEKTKLSKGESAGKSNNTVVGSATPGAGQDLFLGVLVAAESDYGVPVTIYQEGKVG